MPADNATEEFKQAIQDLLREQFNDEFEFGPVVVMPRFDEDGEEYLLSYIVFHGDQRKLDPRKTLRLSGRLWSRSEELGYPGLPSHLFVERSEWPALAKSLA